MTRIFRVPRASLAVSTVFVACALLALSAPTMGASAQEYEVLAARYGVLEGFPLRGLLPDAPEGERLDAALALWVLRDEERVVLFDSGFFRAAWFDRFDIAAYERPDRVLARIGIGPSDVTDIVVSHAHWDHMGGLALFPEATIWIQEEEYRYYTGPAWQEGGRRGGMDRDDILHLVERNLDGRVRLVAGDAIEILPGLTVYTGARHTYASQYLKVEGSTPWVLASDNAYLYRNVDEGRAGATFDAADAEANRAAVRRMVELAGAPERVVPGHDAAVFTRFPEVAPGIVRIRPGG